MMVYDMADEMTKLNSKHEKSEEPTILQVEDGEIALFLATIEGCESCDDLKEQLDDKVPIREIHFTDELGNPGEIENLRLLTENDIETFPKIFTVGRDGEEFWICEMNLDRDEFENCRVMKIPEPM